MTTWDRVAELEHALGDPFDSANPVGHRAVLESDLDGRLPDGGEELLDRFGMNREFVPAALGGGYTGLDTATVMLRAVARRDFGLGLAYGGAVFVPALIVWIDGTTAQQERAAALLARGQRISVALHDLSHGNDFSASGIWGKPQPDGSLVLGGHKRVVTNAPRAEGFVVLARTGRDRRGGAHSALFLERSALTPGSLRDLPPVPEAGPRRAPVGGIEFLDCAVPPQALLGGLNRGTEIMLRGLQVTRPILPSMAVGCADTALRMAARAAAGEGGGAGPAGGGTRYAKRALGASFLDLLLCDCLLLAATRAVHVLPEESSLVTAAAKYLVPRVLEQAVTDLAPALGRGFQHRAGEVGTFRKQARDIVALPPGHAGSAAALASILPQLPVLARRSWTTDPAAPPELFRPDGRVPRLDPSALRAAAPADSLFNTLSGAADVVESMAGLGAQAAQLRAVTRGLVAECAMLRKECRALPERDHTALANPRGYALAERYALLLAAAAALGVWLEAHNRRGGGFLADPAWVIGALGRVCLRLGVPAAADGRGAEPGAAGEVREELSRRLETGGSLDLYDVARGAGL
jgi:alkylation response protein AidB-like acyl-CoA dehydrogenase